MRFREIDFQNFLLSLLQRLEIGEVASEVRIAKSAILDLTLRTENRLYIIECKSDAPQTQVRLDSVAAQLLRYRDLSAKASPAHTPELVLATPGALSKRNTEFLQENGISVWDAAWIADKAASAGMSAEAREYIEPPGRDPRPLEVRSKSTRLAQRLKDIQPGKAEWSHYQKLCQEIFEYLFCPDLNRPLGESKNVTGVNRRDFVMPNYSQRNFWSFMRSEYSADYVVVDPKNYSGKVGKERVLQVANYLQRHGLGLFGIIVCRSGINQAAKLTIREQWILHDKMIIWLTDDDVLQMLTDAEFGGDATVMIRQKIEDFRLGI
ncbi:hypothetical protein P3T37_001823 [Kitasatospora sp. MAA4]|uniref:hypothetical protein n=1 Tax=Kitasatospora sp. MAA4 TaxID=3035093 RepID=UPI0024764143|nr:hypothetical protein [Kitasatospora sp. MAA4]MDH6132438.1 hypothetical protein [Kitasatospora sp. MAA4]